MEYLGPLSFVAYHTRERFDQEGFGEESIRKQSFIWHQQMDEKLPSWLRSRIEINELEDESDMFQYGEYDSTEFYEYSRDIAQPSSWNKFPTSENPSRRYKFASLDLIVGPDKMIISRDTYALLDYLGDLGGLFDALFFIFSSIAAPVATFNMKATILSHFFRFKPKEVKIQESRRASTFTAQSLMDFLFFKKAYSKEDQSTTT